MVDSRGKSFTFAELDYYSNGLARALVELGVEPGTVVSAQMPNWAEFTIAFLGTLKVGAVFNPILPNYRETEVTYITSKCQSSVLIVCSHYRNFDYMSIVKAVKKQVPSIKAVISVGRTRNNILPGTVSFDDLIFKLYNGAPAPPTKVSANDVVLILFTSGTEARPKGVMFTHNNLIFSEKALAKLLGITDRDVVFMPSPVGHLTGTARGVILPLVTGGQAVFQDVFNPDEAVQLMEREQCTWGMGATPFVHDILKSPLLAKHGLSSLRFFLCGGAPIPRDLVERALKNNFKVLAVYGSTESTPHTVNRLNDPLEKIIFTDGAPVPGIEVKVVDEERKPVPYGEVGEEASRGPNVAVGYLKDPELTRQQFDEEGWFYSGDLCVMDEDGYIRIVDRKKDIIIRGGENISCREVEEVLLRHPKVVDIAIVAMPDERLGERACAYVVPQGEFTFEEMVCWLEDAGLAKFKWPERLELISELPKTASGKVQKYILREDIKQKLTVKKQGS